MELEVGGGVVAGRVGLGCHQRYSITYTTLAYYMLW